MVTILDHKMPFKATNADVMQVQVLIPTPGIPLRTQYHIPFRTQVPAIS